MDAFDDITYICLQSTNSCERVLPANARYCTQCGCMSTFYLQDILSNYKEEFNESSNSELRAI